LWQTKPDGSSSKQNGSSLPNVNSRDVEVSRLVSVFLKISRHQFLMVSVSGVVVSVSRAVVSVSVLRVVVSVSRVVVLVSMFLVSVSRPSQSETH